MAALISCCCASPVCTLTNFIIGVHKWDDYDYVSYVVFLIL